jgi:hypothetical protein
MLKVGTSARELMGNLDCRPRRRGGVLKMNFIFKIAVVS